jgi:hypothetical protein
MDVRNIAVAGTGQPSDGDAEARISVPQPS